MLLQGGPSVVQDVHVLPFQPPSGDRLWPGKERMGGRPPPRVPEETVTHLSPLSQRGPGLEIPYRSSQAFPVRWLRLACFRAVLGPEQNWLQHRVFLHVSCPHTRTDPLQSGPPCIGTCVDTAWSLRPVFTVAFPLGAVDKRVVTRIHQHGIVQMLLCLPGSPHRRGAPGRAGRSRRDHQLFATPGLSQGAAGT